MTTLKLTELRVGDRLFAVGRDGGPWYVSEVEACACDCIGPGVQLLCPVRGGSVQAGISFRGPMSDVSRTRAEAEAVAAERQAAYESRAAATRAAREREEADRERRRVHAEELHDRLYELAFRLAGDDDDCDIVEHGCQGSYTRLREFVRPRLAAACPLTGVDGREWTAAELSPLTLTILRRFQGQAKVE